MRLKIGELGAEKGRCGQGSWNDIPPTCLYCFCPGLPATSAASTSKLHCLTEKIIPWLDDEQECVPRKQ